MKHQLELPLFEQWLPIENYEDYQVSNFGNVKSLERIDSLGRTVKERILKQTTSKNGYQLVGLYKDGNEKKFQVHRLVANAFIQNFNNLPQVNHIDECKSNNHVDNLEWCDRKYNCNYGTRNERHSKAMVGKLSGDNHPKPMLGKLGKDNPNSKQVIQLTLNGEVVKIWDSMHDVTRELGYSQGNIGSCCRGERKTSNGYKWQFV